MQTSRHRQGGIRAFFLGFTAVTIGAWITEVLYRSVVVPILGSIDAVPVALWLSISVPLFLSIVCLGMMCRTLFDVVRAAFGGTIGFLAFVFTAALLHLRGFLKSPVLDRPAAFAVISGAICFVAISVISGLTLAAVARVRRDGFGTARPDSKRQ